MVFPLCLVKLDLLYDAMPASGRSAEPIENLVMNSQILRAQFRLGTNVQWGLDPARMCLCLDRVRWGYLVGTSHRRLGYSTMRQC